MFRSREHLKMEQPATLDNLAQGWARRLEADASRRTGLSIKEARQVVAREMGTPVTPAMLRNVSEGRIKAVNAWLLERLRQRIEKQLSKEIQALEHELEIARRCQVDVDEDTIVAVEAHLVAAREKLTALSPGTR